MPSITAGRRGLILDELRLHGSVTVRELAARLRASEVTIRRDLTTLEDHGLAIRVHGGAMAIHAADRVPVRASGHPARPAIVGMVTPSMDYYWPRIVEGVRRTVASSRGRLILRGSSYAIADDRLQISRLVETGQVDGLLLSPNVAADGGADLLRWLEHLGVPVVLLERTLPPEVFSTRIEWVATDLSQAAGLAVRHLVSQGHRRVGLLSSPLSPRRAELVEGWRRACVDVGLPLSVVHREDAPAVGDPGREPVLDAILDQCRATRTTALLVRADREAIALLQRAQDIGLRIPEDLAIVAHDDELSALTDPPLSTIRPSRFEIGAIAANLLLRRLADPALPLHRILLCPELVVRQSSGPHVPRSAN